MATAQLPEAAAAPPQRIGRYTVLRELARGGMAQILLAEVADLPGVKRTVVIKRTLPELARDPAYARMFLDEARIIAALAHPNVVQIVEAGRDGGDLFIAMEHIDGLPLRSLLESAVSAGERIPLEHTLQILGGILAGLHYVHERHDEAGRPLHLIHRDVSPRNVLVTFEGAVKLIDFGIARESNRLGGTRSGLVKGTLHYMSPEQCRGRLLDRRTDVFSAGVLLYELSVGRRLYLRESDFDVLTAIVNEPVAPPTTLVDGYPPELEAVVLRALARSPADRYATAEAFHDALDEVARKLGLTPSTRALQAWVRDRFRDGGEEAGARGATSETGTIGGRTASAESELGEALLGDSVVAAAPGAEVAARPPRSRIAASLVAASLALTAGGALSWSRWQPRSAAMDPPAVTANRAVAPSFATPVVPPPVAPAAPAAARPAAPRPSSASPAPIAPAPTPVAPTPLAPTAPAPIAAVPIAPTPTGKHAAASHPRGRPATSSVAAAGAGELVIDADPWCLVTIDGEVRGPTPVTATLAAGPHRVALRNEEFGIARTATVVVEAGGRVRRRFDFPEEKAKTAR